MDDQHPNKQDPRPKRRKDSDNPYEIFTVGGGTDTPHYYIRFQDGFSAEHCLEISRELFLALNQFELDDLSHLNEVDNHYEHISLSDEELNTRAAYQRETVEETAFRHIEHEKLYAAMKRLPEKQYRRLVLYYFGEFTYEQIAEMEGCSRLSSMQSNTISECTGVCDRNTGRLIDRSSCPEQRCHYEK